MKNIFYLLFLLLITIAKQSGHTQELKDGKYFTLKKSDNKYLFINKGIRKSNADGEESVEDSFRLWLPEKYRHFISGFNGSSDYLFTFRNQRHIFIIDNDQSNDIIFKSNLSMNDFLLITKKIKGLDNAIFNRNIKMKKSKRFGLSSNGKFIICYLNIEDREVEKFNEAIKSLE